MLNYKDLSFWEKRAYTEHIDVAIIGAGIVGMTCALALKHANSSLRVVVLERGYLPTGASSKNAGFACFGSPSEIYSDLASMSEEEVWETVAMRYDGLKRLLELVPAARMGYEACGSWDLLDKNEYISADFLAYLNDNIQKISGQTSCYSEDHEMLEKSGIQGFKFAFKNRLEGSIQTDLLIDSLHASCIAADIKFLYGTPVQSIDSGELLTPYGTLHANQVVVCTNGFAANLLPLDVTPTRAQVLVTTPIDDLAINGTFHFDEGYYYFRNIGNRILFGGGRNLDFTGEQTLSMEPTARIQNHLISLLQTNIIPGKSFDIAYQWAGTMGLGTSKKPLIKRIDKHTVVGVRMGGMGVAIGSLVGEKLSKIVLNE